MKKLLCFLMLIPLITPAQEWSWANTSKTNSGHQWASQLTTDASGNVFVLGKNHGSSQFATANLDSGVFLLKYDMNGNQLWGKNLPYSPARIDADPLGNLYLGGNYTLNLLTETDTFHSKGNFDIFLVKMDANGVEKWARSYGNSGSNMLLDLASDSKGNIAIGGGYQGDTILFHNYSAISSSLSSAWFNFFVGSISPDGTTKWVNTGPVYTDTHHYDLANFIEISSSDHIFVIGIGGGCVGAPGCSANFLAKFDTSGNQYFHKWGGSTMYGGIVEFKLDKYDNIYFIDEARYSTTYYKTDDQFTYLWSFPATNHMDCYGNDNFAVDREGNSVLTGYLIYQKSSSGTCTNAKGQVTVHGYTCHVNHLVLHNSDIVLTTLNSSGKVTGLTYAGGNNSEMIHGVTLRNGACYVSGSFNVGTYTTYYSDTLVMGTHTLQSNSVHSQAFVAKTGNHLLTGFAEEKTSPSDFLVFPNPAQTFIKIEGVTSTSEVKFTDMFGNTVLTIAPEQNNPEIDITMLPQGVYIIELRSKEGFTHHKIIKE